jgi:hypothetical protein
MPARPSITTAARLPPPLPLPAAEVEVEEEAEAEGGATTLPWRSKAKYQNWCG